MSKTLENNTKKVRLVTLYHDVMLALSSPGEDQQRMSAHLTLSQYNRCRQRLCEQFGSVQKNAVKSMRAGVRFGDLAVYARQVFHQHFRPGVYFHDSLVSKPQQSHLLNTLMCALDQYVSQESG